MSIKDTIAKIDEVRDAERAEIEALWDRTFDMKLFSKYGTKYADAWARKALMPKVTKTLNDSIKAGKE